MKTSQGDQTMKDKMANVLLIVFFASVYSFAGHFC